MPVAAQGRRAPRVGRRALAWLASALFWGAGVQPAAAAEEAPLDVETILANPLDAEDYRRGKRCIPARGYRRIEVLDERNLLFVGRKRTWLNRLRGRCLGLREDMVIYLDVQGMRVCQLDDFRARRSGAFGAPTPMCVLGEFEEIDEAQMQGLRDAVAAAQRSTKREADAGG